MSKEMRALMARQARDGRRLYTQANATPDTREKPKKKMTRKEMQEKFGLFREWNDPNREKKIRAALELKIFSIEDICKVGLFYREYVEQLSLKHCPDDHQGNMARQSTATSEEISDLEDVLGILGKRLKRK